MKSFFALLMIASSCSAASWTAGFNFRSTSGYRTDPAGSTWAIQSSTPYPTSRLVAGKLVTFGWEPLPGGLYQADFRTDVDARLAGVNCHRNDGIPAVFRVDLPAAGQYDVSIAVGSVVFTENHHVAVESGGVQLLAVDGVSLGSTFLDATQTPYSYAVWGTSSTSVRRYFGAAQLRMTLGGTADGGFSCVAHISVTQVAAPAIAAGVRSFFLQ